MSRKRMVLWSMYALITVINLLDHHKSTIFHVIFYGSNWLQLAGNYHPGHCRRLRVAGLRILVFIFKEILIVEEMRLEKWRNRRFCWNCSMELRCKMESPVSLYKKVNIIIHRKISPSVTMQKVSFFHCYVLWQKIKICLSITLQHHGCYIRGSLYMIR